MPTPLRSVRRLAEMIANPSRALVDQEYWYEPVCRRWLDHVAEQAQVDPAAAQRLAIVGVRLALRIVRRRSQRKIHDQGILARSHGVLGSIYRRLEKFDKAARALEKAASRVRSCVDRDDRSDIHRRQAILRAYQAQQPDGSFDQTNLRTGLELAEAAVREARGALALGRAHIARGILKIRSGDPSSAAQDARRALELLKPTVFPGAHVSALSVLVSALARGSKADRGEAIAHLVQLREALPRRAPVLRARLLWAEALLYIPDRQRKGRAGHLLIQARSRFLKHRMQAEAIAVTADLARLQPTGAVEELCAELLPILDAGPLRDRVEKLGQIRLFERVDVAEQLRAALDGHGLLPAAAWPPP